MPARPWDVGNDSEIVSALGRVNVAAVAEYMRQIRMCLIWAQ